MLCLRVRRYKEDLKNTYLNTIVEKLRLDLINSGLARKIPTPETPPPPPKSFFLYFFIFLHGKQPQHVNLDKENFLGCGQLDVDFEEDPAALQSIIQNTGITRPQVQVH